MTDQAAARRMRLLEELRGGGGREISEYAAEFQVDDRTIRRDIDALQDLIGSVDQVALRRGRVYAARGGSGPGYFSDHVGQNQPAKEEIARAVVSGLEDNLAILVTAGSTTYHVAREIRRAHVEEKRPRNIIAFTNSLPALLEFVAAGVSTGVIGEVYNADDSAFHTHELHTSFQASVAIVGASGVVANSAAGALELFSHRAEEAAFLKQLLAPIPEVVVAADASKLGRRHPWAFAGSALLAGKSVKFVTDRLSSSQRETLDALAASARKTGCYFSYEETPPSDRQTEA